MNIGEKIDGKVIENIELSHSGAHALQLLQLRDEAGRSWGYSIDGGAIVGGFGARHEVYRAATEALAAILAVTA